MHKKVLVAVASVMMCEERLRKVSKAAGKSCHQLPAVAFAVGMSSTTLDFVILCGGREVFSLVNSQRSSTTYSYVDIFKNSGSNQNAPARPAS